MCPEKDGLFAQRLFFFSFLQIKSVQTDTSASLTIEKVEEKDVGSNTIRIINEDGEATAELTLIMIGV